MKTANAIFVYIREGASKVWKGAWTPRGILLLDRPARRSKEPAHHARS
jgi:hypothetical protein